MSTSQTNGSGSSASHATASTSTLDKGKGPASSSTATAADADLFDDAELDRIFNQEASQVAREAEVRLPVPHQSCGRRRGLTLRLTGLQVLRVLAAFKLNPYEILDLNWMPSAGITDTDIRSSALLQPVEAAKPC
jgi:DnaJ family protein C protein 8